MIQLLHRYNPQCTELLVRKTTYPAMPYHSRGNEAICTVDHTELQWPRLSSQASLLCPLWIVSGPRFVQISLLPSSPDRCRERKGKKAKYILSSAYFLKKKWIHEAQQNKPFKMQRQVTFQMPHSSGTLQAGLDINNRNSKQSLIKTNLVGFIPISVISETYRTHKGFAHWSLGILRGHRYVHSYTRKSKWFYSTS